LYASSPMPKFAVRALSFNGASGVMPASWARGHRARDATAGCEPCDDCAGLRDAHTRVVFRGLSIGDVLRLTVGGSTRLLRRSLAVGDPGYAANQLGYVRLAIAHAIGWRAQRLKLAAGSPPRRHKPTLTAG
jgi:excinuclease UvrABC ATPase subunit